MKNIFSILLYLLLLLGLSSSLLAQPGFEPSLQASLFVNGVDDPMPSSHSLRNNTVIPGPSFAIGTKHMYYFVNRSRNYFTFNTGLLYEFHSFTRYQREVYNNNSFAKRKQNYRLQYLSIPTEIEFHFKKLSLSTGFIFSSLLSLRIRTKNCFAQNSNNCDYQKQDPIKYALNDRVSTDAPYQNHLDNPNNLQYSVGLHYRLNDHLKIGLAFREFLTKSTFTNIRVGTDTIDRVRYTYQTKSLDLSFLYLLK